MVSGTQAGGHGFSSGGQTVTASRSPAQEAADRCQHADATSLLKRGLEFSKPDVSRLLDAADAFRRVLAVRPDRRAAEALDAVKRRLIPLAARVRSESTNLVRPEEWYEFYLSPFEALRINPSEHGAGPAPGIIQRAKKALVAEIQLEGKVKWLGGYTLDLAHAHRLEDELLDGSKARFHRAVFENKPVLQFLSRGDVTHFLYSDEYVPQSVLELLDDGPSFKKFLSKPLARQYNRVLSRAIENRRLAVIEALGLGRVWVDSEDEDECFSGAGKRIDTLVEQLRAKAGECRGRKIGLTGLQEFLRQRSLPELLNLLPPTLATKQADAVRVLRELAIECWNAHGDAELSKGVLTLCQQIRFRDAALAAQLGKDFEFIDRKIEEERKYEWKAPAFSTLASGQFQITKEGIRYKAKFIPAAAVTSVRWGAIVTHYSGYDEYAYSLNVRSESGDTITASWAGNKSLEQLETHQFGAIVTAAAWYLGAPVIEKLHARVGSGEPVIIGPCTLTQQGIVLRRQKWLLTREYFVPWRDVAVEQSNGNVLVSSAAQTDLTVSLAMVEVDNAVVLPILIRMLTESPQAPATHDATMSGAGGNSKGQPELGGLQGVTASEKCLLAAGLIFVLIGITASLTSNWPTQSTTADPPNVKVSDQITTTAEDIEKADLERERQIIDIEIEKIDRMNSELERFNQQLERESESLDRTNRSDVAVFNRKVAAYNEMLRRLREQEKKLEGLIENYNRKLPAGHR